jgi:riboflavin synthase alpha subunit
MFTGLVGLHSKLWRTSTFTNVLLKIEHLGTVNSILRDAGGCTLTISHSALILDDCRVGDSIAVNGACLTVTEFDKEEHGGYFKVWLANETLDRTDLGRETCQRTRYIQRQCIFAQVVARSAIR